MALPGQLSEQLNTLDIKLDARDIAQIEPLYQEYKHLAGQKVMVMFSGGIDTSFISHFLQHVIGAEVTSFTANVGSVTAPTNMEEVKDRSKELGLSEHVEIDGREKLAELGMQAVMAQAKLGPEGHHPASSLSRVVICDEAVRLAKEKGITALFHGSNGSQNNPFRFHGALKYYGEVHDYSQLQECTPNLRDDGELSAGFREVQDRYLKAVDCPSKGKAYEQNISHDRNLLGDEWEEAKIANPANRVDVRDFLTDIAQRQEPTRIQLRFAAGTPVALKVAEGEWKEKSPQEMFETLNELGLQYRIGIVDHPEGRPIGINAREIHIAPGMELMQRAHDKLQGYCFGEETVKKLNDLSLHWSNWVMEKNLYTHNHVKGMNLIFKMFNRHLNGEVSLEMEPGQIVNVTTSVGEKTMEGTQAPATSAEVADYIANNTAASMKERTENFERSVLTHRLSGKSQALSTALAMRGFGEPLPLRQLELALEKMRAADRSYEPVR